MTYSLAESSKCPNSFIVKGLIAISLKVTQRFVTLQMLFNLYIF